MIYIKNFTLLDEMQEHYILTYEEQRKIFNNSYPMNLFSSKLFKNIYFDEITIFYGGNGSGKTTLINMISEKLNALRRNRLEKGSDFNLYVKPCDYEISKNNVAEIKLITSDDVFDYLLDIRSINSNMNRRKEYLSREYIDYKYSNDRNSLVNYDKLVEQYEAKTQSMSKFVRERLGNNNLTEMSNGESALMFWEKEIREDGLYILDEPENSLSAENQLKLKKIYRGFDKIL